MLVRRCERCGTKNRVDPSDLVNEIRCDKCKEILGPTAGVIAAALRDLRNVGMAQKVPLVVLFSGLFCPQSKQMLAQLAPVAAKWVGKALFFNVAVEENADVGTVGVRVTPTLMLGKRAALLHTHEGMAPVPDIEEWLRRASAAREVTA